MAGLTESAQFKDVLQRLALDPNYEIILRRFGEPMTGSDLEEIRRGLFGLSQEELGSKWGVSRTQILRMEKRLMVDAKTCDAYRGLMLRHFLGSF